jgi:Spy/CpxP family protein refolding chaperone
MFFSQSRHARSTWAASNQSVTAKENTTMIDHMRRIGLSLAAGLIATGMAAGVVTATQNQNTSEPQGSFSGRRGGPPPMGIGGPGAAMGPMGIIGPIIGRLGLSDSQKDQLKSIMQAHRDEFQTMRTQSMAAHKALEQAILQDPVSDAAVQSASAGVAAVESQMAVAAAHVRSEVFQMLTDAQKAQVKDLIAKRDARTGRGRGR